MLPKAKKAVKVKKIASSPFSLFAQHDAENEEDDRKETCQRLLDKGAEFAEMGSFEEAARMFLTAVDYDPTNSAAFEMLAQVYLEMNMTFQAVRHAERSHTLAPAWPDALHTLARCQREYGELPLSLQSYDKLLILQPNDQVIASECAEVRALCAELERRQSQLVVNPEQSVEDQEVRRCFQNLCKRCHVTGINSVATPPSESR